jgi:hypothetical protein
MKHLRLLLIFFAIGAVLGGGGWAAMKFLCPDKGSPTDPMPVRSSSEDPPEPEQADPSMVSAQVAVEREPAKADPVPVQVQKKADPGGPVGSLRGRVVNSQREAVFGAQVEVMRGPSLGMQISGLRESLGVEAQSDEEGRFTFSGLAPAEDYVVVVQHPEYGDSEAGPVVLRAGADVEVGEIILRKGSSVYGLITGGGRPIEGAVVSLRSTMHNFAMSQAPKVPQRDPVELTVSSESDGTYEFTSVPIRNFEVTVEAEGFGRMTKTSQSFFGGGTRNQEINFELGIATEIAGMVVDANGRPLPSATVKALITNASFRSDGETVSGGDGSFRLEQLADGHYFLSATLEGYSQGSRQRVTSGTTDLVLKLLPQGSVSGMVVDEETGKPVTSFELSVYRHLNGRKPARVGINKSFRSSDGRFELKGLDPNQYILEARASGYAASRSEPFTAARGETASGVTVEMNRGGSIAGVVTNANGKPLMGALVTINNNNFRWNPVHDLLNRMAKIEGEMPKVRTNENGEFRVDMIVPETYQIAVKHSDFAPYHQNDILVQKKAVTDLGQLSLSQGAIIRGTAFGEDGSPLAGAQIQAATKEGDILTSRCDGQGRFEFKGVPPAQYTVSINSYQSDPPENVLLQILKAKHSQQEVSVQEGRVANLELRITSPQN